MKETPILFKPEMIRAILSGQKTQTRRLIKPQPKDDGRQINVFCPGGLLMDGVEYQNISCPYGRKGDLLWVRETVVTSLVEDLRYKADGKWFYPSTEEERRWVWNQETCTTIPSIHMPKWASRLWLELTADPIPQRLQEITEEDAIVEGIGRCIAHGKDLGWTNYLWHGLFGQNGGGNKKSDAWAYQYSTYRDAIGCFSSLWESINGLGTWEKNPWVWKLNFKRRNG